MRVNTIRHRWLAWRSPPRLSRWRVVLPEEAGMGAAAHRCAQAASERSRSGWSPAAMSSSAAVLGPTPNRASSPGACAWVDRLGTGPGRPVARTRSPSRPAGRGPGTPARCGCSRRHRRPAAARRPHTGRRAAPHTVAGSPGRPAAPTPVVGPIPRSCRVTYHRAMAARPAGIPPGSSLPVLVSRRMSDPEPGISPVSMLCLV